MKVLVTDDDPTMRALLARWATRWGYEVFTASSGEQALEILKTEPGIQLCVLDWMMPGISGLDVCRALRAHGEEPYIYTILLSAKTDIDDLVEGLEAGADDYVVKPCRPLELEVRLRAGKRVVDLQRNLIAAREQLRVEAAHDALTGLLNRKAILEVLDRDIRRAQRHGESTCVLMLDIDFFKSINDGYGHQAGDAVLRQMPQRLAQALRNYDVAGRYGGEEFLIVLGSCDSAGAMHVAERVRLAVRSVPMTIPRGQLEVACSVGVAGTDQFPGADAEALIRAADAALYRSKNQGRDRVTLATAQEFVLDQAVVSSRRPLIVSEPE